MENIKETMGAEQYSPLTLAYVGDSVYELMVRGYITRGHNMAVNKLHQHAKEYVAACYQSAYMNVLTPLLSEEELAIYKRGRNAKSHTMAKNMTMIDYRRATGLEALFGYLYLAGRMQRAEELFAAICDCHDEVVEALKENGK